ncbi:rhodanese-like domain-containing protein [Nibribacter ruber]|nr:rhodanese-like domain-containing protein [Nibribacter ruber]
MLALSMTFLGACAQQKSPEQLSPSQFKTLAQKEKGVVVDVRTPEEFAAGHLQAALLSDFRGGQFAKDFAGWDKDKTYYLYCASGNRSGQAAKLMLDAGFTKVYNVGAFNQLKEGGLPVEDKK